VPAELGGASQVFDAECLPRDFHAEAARFKKEGRGT